MMKRKFLFFSVSFLFLAMQTIFPSPIFSEDSDLYNEFLRIYNLYSDPSSAYFFVQELRQYNSSGGLEKEISAKSINLSNSQITSVSQKNGDLYFLSTNSGYWTKSKKLKQAIKISGSYKVMDIQMQDLLRLDFQNDFEITEDFQPQSVLLKRVNKKNSYSYLRLNENLSGEEQDKERNVFAVEVLDSNMKKIKSIFYESSQIKGITLFSKIAIYDEFVSAGSHYDYITLDLKKLDVKISKSLFSLNFMDELVEILESQ